MKIVRVSRLKISDCPLENFISFINNYKIYSEKQWAKFRKSNRDLISGLPSDPEKFYKKQNFSWKGVRPDNYSRGKQWATLQEFIDFIKNHKIYSSHQWKIFRKSHAKLTGQFHGEPQIYYDNFSWEEVRPDNYSYTSIDGDSTVKFFPSSKEFAAFAKKHKIYSEDKWDKFRKDNLEFVGKFPTNPLSYYKKDNFSWTGIRPDNYSMGKEFASLQEFTAFMASHKIYTYHQWQKFRKENKGFIGKFPSNPLKSYDGFKWRGVKQMREDGKRDNLEYDPMRNSIHMEGGESRSWHEVIIRDIFFFTGMEFTYEPQNWTNLSFVEDFKHKCFGEAINYNKKYLSKKRKEDPDYVMPSTPYQNTYPQPDFLINNVLFEVFGGSPEEKKYEISMGFKKEKFTKFFSNHFAYIDKTSLTSASVTGNRTLISYAIALDTKVEGAKFSIGNQFQSKLETIAQLLGENNIQLNENYRTQISSFNQDQIKSTEYDVKDELASREWPTDKDVNAPIPIPWNQLPKAIAPEQTETATDQAVASNDSWYKLAQSSGYNRTEPASMSEISSALKQEGFWSSHRWSENDRIAMYFKTPENLQMALSKLQQPIMEFPQQEQQIAAFNLSRMKK
jgi:hypothetical protein